MSEKEKISRRKFFENVAKYCGAGLAMVGLVSVAKKAGAVTDLDQPADSLVWTMRDVQLDQYGEFINNAPIQKDYFDRDLAKFVDGGKPVKWSHLHSNYYSDGKKSVIAIQEATPLDKDLKGDIKKAMEKIGGFGRSLKKSDKILIKPNWNTGDPWPGGGTDAKFLRALIGVLQDEGYANLTVGDSCGPWGPTERVYKDLGHDVVCKECGVNLIDFEKLPWMHITNPKAELLGRFPGGYGNQDGTVGYTAALRDFDKVIYTPVMKTHFLGHITMALKLSVGILHRADRGGQLHNFNHIFTGPQAAEINLPFQPDLVIMDGRRSFIAGGPSHGQMVKPGFILASGDQVANDVMGIKILQEWYPFVQNKITMDAWHVNQIAQAVKLGIGYAKSNDDIKMVIW
jgi:uncharacterized protein (DUF362 family)